MPAVFWINLFRFYGYDYIKTDPDIFHNINERGTHLFYDTKIVRNLPETWKKNDIIKYKGKALKNS